MDVAEIDSVDVDVGVVAVSVVGGGITAVTGDGTVVVSVDGVAAAYS